MMAHQRAGNKFYDKRHKISMLESQMRYERESFIPYWKDLSEYILPRRSRIFITDVNKGDRRNLSIIDSSATTAARTLSSGMMTGVTSPARAWFKLTTNSKELNDNPEVKRYFELVEEEMRRTFNRTNLYNQLPVVYGDLGTFATGLLLQEEDDEKIMNFTCLPVGSYMIANDKRGQVKSFFREFQMSVRQIVEKFGMRRPGDHKNIDWSNISQLVKDYYQRDQLETMININHMIISNEEYDPSKFPSKYKRYISYYYEQGSGSGSGAPSSSNTFRGTMPDKFLSEKGFDYFPALAVRWEVTGEDTYGTNAPGMVGLGDTKQLQLGEKRIFEAIDQKIKPSMTGPTALRNQGASIVPGKITYMDEREGVKGFRRLFDVNFDTREMEGKQEQIRQRISKVYYEDLFLMLANSDRRQITATEIAERQEEKLLALGPVLERMNQDLLDPLIENTFMIMNNQGLLPEPPEVLADTDYTIEYISVMAQAQKLAGIGGLERFVGFLGQTAQFEPSTLIKANFEEIIEKYADMLGVDPSLIRTKEEVEAIQEVMAAQQAQNEAAERMASMAQTGKTLSETEINEENALGQILGANQGA